MAYMLFCSVGLPSRIISSFQLVISHEDLFSRHSLTRSLVPTTLLSLSLAFHFLYVFFPLVGFMFLILLFLQIPALILVVCSPEKHHEYKFIYIRVLWPYTSNFSKRTLLYRYNVWYDKHVTASLKLVSAAQSIQGCTNKSSLTDNAASQSQKPAYVFCTFNLILLKWVSVNRQIYRDPGWSSYNNRDDLSNG